MTHPIARFDIVGQYTLKLEFTDGTTQEINFQPVLHGALFGPLRDPEVFNAVILDQEVGTLTWPNGADFDPATLHEWPAVRAELAARAQAWAEPTPNEPRARPTREWSRRAAEEPRRAAHSQRLGQREQRWLNTVHGIAKAQP